MNTFKYFKRIDRYATEVYDHVNHDYIKEATDNMNYRVSDLHLTEQFLFRSEIANSYSISNQYYKENPYMPRQDRIASYGDERDFVETTEQEFNACFDRFIKYSNQLMK